MKIFLEIVIALFINFSKSKSFIFISGYMITALLYWRHFIAAAALVDDTTIFLISFTYLIIFAISFIFTKIVSYAFSANSDGHFFYSTWFFAQLALLALFGSYEKYEPRITVYHEVMKVAPDTGRVGVSGAAKKCNSSMMRQDWERAYRECLAGSAEGSSEAQTNLAYLYFEGLGPLEHAPDEGNRNRRLLKIITREVLPQAQESLLQDSPKISESDANIQAELLFKKAADQGLLAAQYNLGVFYIGGNSPYPEFGEKDYDKEDEKAFKYTRLAAMQGDAEAIYNLAVMYDQGSGVGKDSRIADRLYRISASKGFKLAKKVIWLNGIWLF
jgi:TPR repeat protein